jgi:hypothetical protein
MSRLPNTTVTASNTVQAHPLDEEQYGLDCTDKLPTGVTVSSATLSQKKADGTATTDLTLGSATVNASTFEGYQGRTVAIGKGILFTVEDGVGGEDYLITAKLTCSDTKVRNIVCPFKVRDGDE